MDKNDEDRILHVLDTVAEMAIATLREDGWPQTTTVAFANDGLAIYFGTAADSQKAANIAHDPRVSIAMHCPYRLWKDILGLSLAGRASRVTEPAEYRRAGQVLFEKFPQVHDYARMEREDEVALYRVDPTVISLLDYSKGFGHATTIEPDER